MFLRVLFLFLRGQNNIAKIIDQSIDILAEETQVKHERERAAETVTMFKCNIGSCIHHQLSGKPGLSKPGILACLGKTAGHIIAEGTLTGLFYDTTSLSLALDSTSRT